MSLKWYSLLVLALFLGSASTAPIEERANGVARTWLDNATAVEVAARKDRGRDETRLKSATWDIPSYFLYSWLSPMSTYFMTLMNHDSAAPDQTIRPSAIFPLGFGSN
ncbi:hypothetical protein CERSUDRAFT_90121 [Gelatoporia subvermispora B]|uniref:Uncharacterized protein n=1 Tax=Ceriporiopsis subvermispora (strain B) TaxID=914234 RepID=M2QWQ8_CERS8|nr:hypothetical protein CERSUDRAFT_90121 [Gelatoporia subvermispora B]